MEKSIFSLLQGVSIATEMVVTISAHKSSDMPIQATLWQVLSELRKAGV